MAVKLTAVKKQVEVEERRLKAAQQVTAEFVDMSVSLCRKQVGFLQKLGELKEEELAEEEIPVIPFKEEKPQEVFEPQADSSTKVFAAVQEAVKIAEPKIAKAKLPEGWDDDDEPASPRPKFEFHDLKFGKRFNDED